MKLFIYSIYDIKAEAFINPIFLPTEAMAVRVFQDSVDDPNHAFGRHPEDYTLYSLGLWESNNATFDLNDKRVVLTGLEAKRQFDIDDTVDTSLLKEQTI